MAYVDLTPATFVPVVERKGDGGWVTADGKVVRVKAPVVTFPAHRPHRLKVHRHGQTPPLQDSRGVQKGGELSAPSLQAKDHPDPAFNDNRLRRAASWERTVARMMRAYFDRQRTVVLQKLTGSKMRQAAEKAAARGETKAVDPGSIFDNEAWKEQLAADAAAWVQQIMDDFGGEQAEAFGIEFNAEDPRVAEALANQVNRIVGINDTTYGQITDALAEGEAQGETIAELANRVSGVFEEARGQRAELIARTEVMGALNSASLEAAYQSGQARTKTWVTAMDERVCPVCEPMDDETVNLDETFSSGDDAPPAHPDCRCTAYFSAGDGSTLGDSG